MAKLIINEEGILEEKGIYYDSYAEWLADKYGQDEPEELPFGDWKPIGIPVTKEEVPF